MARLTIRKADPTDEAFFAELLTQLGYPASADEVHGRMEQLDRDEQSVLIAELDGELAGVAVIQIYPVLVQDAPICRLAVLVVAERTRRRGVARTLTLAVEEEARRAGCDRIVLESGIRRGEAHEFYRTLGYENHALEFRKLL